MRRLLTAFLLVAVSSRFTAAAVVPGLVNDFEDGTLQGWNPPVGNTQNLAGGPTGSTRFLQVSPGNNGRLAAFSPQINGVIDSAVTAFSVDLMRPAGQTDLEIRMVLFGPTTNDRWTSTVSQLVAGDGVWRSFVFSVAEVDLTRAQGTGTYTQLTSGLNQLMFRWDTGAPSANGTTGGSGTFGMDNVAAVPEPCGVLLVTFTMVGSILRRHRKNGALNMG